MTRRYTNPRLPLTFPYIYDKIFVKISSSFSREMSQIVVYTVSTLWCILQ